MESKYLIVSWYNGNIYNNYYFGVTMENAIIGFNSDNAYHKIVNIIKIK